MVEIKCILMDTCTHLDRSMKIKRWTLSNASSRATWENLSASSSIEWIRIKDDDSRISV